jgi:pimeloyl-ACP methyl ester carboxylesterase
VGYDDRVRLPDGRLLGYLDEGDREGTPVLFFHGSPGSRLAAIDLVGRVVDRGGRIIAPDRPGMGLSEPTIGRSLASWADDVAELANALGLARFGLLAQSGGGPFALATAWALPNRVERVALLSSAGSFDIPGAMDGMSRAERMLWRMARWQPRLLRWMLARQRSSASKDPERFVASIIERSTGADRVAIEELDPERRVRYLVPPFLEALRQGAAGGVEDMRLLRAPWGFGVQHISVPVHLWHGEQDVATPLAMGGWLAAMIPGVEAHILAGEGHTSTILRYVDEALDVLLVDGRKEK